MSGYDEAIALLERLEKRVGELEQENKRALKKGLIILGTAVVALGTYIWSIKVG